MGNEEEKEEKVIDLCEIHKLQMSRSFSNATVRKMIWATQPILLNTYLMGKGFTTREEVQEEMSGRCPNCYWGNLLIVTTSIFQALGYPVNVDEIQDGEIDKPGPTIWKN